MEKDLNNDNFKGALFQNFDKEVVQAPKIVWDNVEKELFGKKKKTGVFWFSSLMIVCLLSAFGYYLYFQNSTKKNLSVKSQENLSAIDSKKSKQQNVSHNKIVAKKTTEFHSNIDFEKTNSTLTIAAEQKTSFEKAKTTEIIDNNIKDESIQSFITKNTFIEPKDQNLKPSIDSNRQQLQLFRFPYLQPLLVGSVLTLKTISTKANDINCFQKISFQTSINRGINVRKIEGEFNTQSMKSKTIGERRIPTKLTQFQFGINYHLNDKFSINSGVYFSKSTFQSRWFYRQLFVNTGENAVELRTMNGEASLNDQQIVSDLATGDTILYKIRANYSASFYSIPVGFTYRFNNQKFSPFLRYGISLDLHSKANISLDIQKNGTYKSIDLNLKNNSIQLALQQMASFGFEYKFSNNWSSFLESKLAIPVSKINIASDYKLKSSYFTLGVGLIYKLPCKN